MASRSIVKPIASGNSGQPPGAGDPIRCAKAARSVASSVQVGDRRRLQLDGGDGTGTERIRHSGAFQDFGPRVPAG